MFVHIISLCLESLVQTSEFAPVFILFLVCSIMLFFKFRRFFVLADKKGIQITILGEEYLVFAFFASQTICFADLDFGQRITTRLTLTLPGA